MNINHKYINPLCLQWHFQPSSILYVKHLVSLAGFVSRSQNQLLDQSGMSYLGARSTIDRPPVAPVVWISTCIKVNPLNRTWFAAISVTSPGSVGTVQATITTVLRNLRIRIIWNIMELYGTISVYIEFRRIMTSTDSTRPVSWPVAAIIPAFPASDPSDTCAMIMTQ